MVSFDVISRIFPDNNYFNFDDRICTQTFGLPMGNPLSPTIAEIVFDKLLNEISTNLKTFGIDIKFLLKCVYDIFAVAKREETVVILRQLKSYNKRLQYTIEMEQYKCIPILNV